MQRKKVVIPLKLHKKTSVKGFKSPCILISIMLKILASYNTIFCIVLYYIILYLVYSPAVVCGNAKKYY